MMSFVIHGSPTRLGARNGADRFERIQIEDRQLPHGAIARDVQTAAFDVGRNIVKAALAARFDFLDYFVRTGARIVLRQPNGCRERYG